MKPFFTGLLLLILLNDLQAQYIDSTLRADTTFTFRDSRDGREYKAVRVNGQIWMAENLRYNVRGSWCYDTKGGCKLYGRLYTWEGAMTACPKGWHIPSISEWQTIINYCGGDKEAGRELTHNSYLGFDMKFGFPPNINGRYSKDGTQATFWTSEEYNKSTAWVYYFIYDKLPLVYMNYFSKNYGMMCRCVKDNGEIK